jgi:hypothetical protein
MKITTGNSAYLYLPVGLAIEEASASIHYSHDIIYSCILLDALVHSNFTAQPLSWKDFTSVTLDHDDVTSPISITTPLI